jgi:hypothetical protein
MITEPKVKRAMRAYYDGKGFKELDSSEGHEPGWDLVFRHRRGGTYVFVEAKGEGRAKQGMESSIIHGLGQIVARFSRHRNHISCLALPAGWTRRALRKISKDVLRVLNLRVALVDTNGCVREITLRNYDVYSAGQARRPRRRAGARLSLLDLTAEVLAKAKKPMSCGAIVAKVLATGRWQTKGKTPYATLYAAILREIGAKGDAARFRRTDRGQFEYAG